MKICQYFCKMNKILLHVIGLTYSHSQSGAYALILGEKNSKRRLPIIIGSTEAQSIALALENFENPRPLTHDLIKNISDIYNIQLKEIIINNFKEGLFYSELHTMRDGEESIIDSRTSDAVAIALRFNAPIYTYPKIIDEAGIIMDDIESENTGNYEIDIESDFERYSIKELEELLNEAIEEEDYEKASKLRDEINYRKK